MRNLRPAFLAACVARLEFVLESVRAAPGRSALAARAVAKNVLARMLGAPTSLVARDLKAMSHEKNEIRILAQIADQQKGQSRLLPNLKRVHQRRTPWLKEFH